MMNSQQAVNLVQQGLAPSSWQVWRGKRAQMPSPFKASGIVLFVILVAGLLLNVDAARFLTSLSTVEGEGSRTTHPGLNPIQYWLASGALIVVLALLGALLAGLIVARRARNIPDPLVILLPEGVIAYFTFKHTIFDTLSFAEVKKIKFNKNDNPNPTYRFCWMDVWKRDGDKEEWDMEIGSLIKLDVPAEAVFQAIITAYKEYAARSSDTPDLDLDEEEIE